MEATNIGSQRKIKDASKVRSGEPGNPLANTGDKGQHIEDLFKHAGGLQRIARDETAPMHQRLSALKQHHRIMGNPPVHSEKDVHDFTHHEKMFDDFVSGKSVPHPEGKEEFYGEYEARMKGEKIHPDLQKMYDKKRVDLNKLRSDHKYT